MAATWLAWTVFAGASGAGAYRASNGENPLGNSCGDGDAAAITITANKNTLSNKMEMNVNKKKEKHRKKSIKWKINLLKILITKKKL